MIRAMAIIGLAVLAIEVTPALAQSAREPAVAEGFPLPIDPGLAADTGKPRSFVLPPVPPPAAGCAAAFDCRVRVLGTVRHDGAVELNATVLKW
jgi:hypothetical protein